MAKVNNLQNKWIRSSPDWDDSLPMGNTFNFFPLVSCKFGDMSFQAGWAPGKS